MFARVCVPDARELGELGEEVAVRCLLRAGFVIAGRRVRTPHAEIDVLARDGITLVLVEVKAMRTAPVPGPRGAFRDPSRARFQHAGRFGTAQVRRLLRAASWLAGMRRTPCRLDGIDVHLCARSRRIRVEHRRDLEKDLPDPGGPSRSEPWWGTGGNARTGVRLDSRDPSPGAFNRPAFPADAGTTAEGSADP